MADSDQGVGKGIEKRVRLLEGKVKRLQSRVGGVGQRARGGSGGPRDRGMRHGEKWTGSWVVVPSADYQNGWAPGTFGPLPRYAVVGSMVIVQAGMERTTTDTAAVAFSIPAKYAPSETIFLPMRCGSSLTVFGYSSIRDNGEVSLVGPYPDAEDLSYIHYVYPYEP